MATGETGHPIVSLMTDVASDLAYLVQTEFRLARAEMGEKLSAASNAGAYLGIGAAIGLAGFIVLLLDIARWITVAGLPYEWSLLIVARRRLAENLDELSDRLTPGQVFDEMLSYSRAGSGAFFRAVSNTVRENPLPSLLIGAGCMILLSEKISDTAARMANAAGRMTGAAASSARSAAASIQSGLGSAANSASRQASNMTEAVVDTMRQTAATVGDTMSQTAATVGDTVAGAADAVRGTSHEKRDQASAPVEQARRGAQIMASAAHDTATARNSTVGQRGAVMADTVGSAQD